MQQTELYKLNKIERNDSFSPDPLNENAETVEKELARLDGARESAMTAEAAARESADAALSDRVTQLEAKKIVVGSYTGSGTTSTPKRTINLGFTPIAVFMLGNDTSPPRMLVTGYTANSHTIVEDGFQVSYGSSGTYNTKDVKYHYLAFA